MDRYYKETDDQGSNSVYKARDFLNDMFGCISIDDNSNEDGYYYVFTLCVHVQSTPENRFWISRYIDEFDNELIRDYFNDFELDNDITLHIDNDEDEFGKFYSISFGLHKLTREMVDELRNSMVRVCSKENLEFESAVIGGWQTENIDEFNNHLYEWTILNTHPPYIELVLKGRD